MAVSVFSVIRKIEDLLMEEPEVLKGIREDFDRMGRALRLMKSFLIRIDLRNKFTIRFWLAEIKDVVYDAEDVIHTFLRKTTVCFLEERRIIRKTKSKISEIIDKITYLTRKLEGIGVEESIGGESLHQRQQLSHYYQYHPIVGMDRQTDHLVSTLLQDYRVISICGMVGSGKTTLAKAVYNHERVRNNFVGHAWVYVSYPWKRNKIWEDIFYGLGIFGGKDSKYSDEELAKKLYKFLEDNKCIVLDDIRTVEVWDSIKPAFPINCETQSLSKILITSSNRQLSAYPALGGYLYEMQGLSEEQSFNVLRNIAFSETDFGEQYSAKNKLAAEILRYCRGLPSAIVVIGGMLATKRSIEEWEMLLNHVKSNLSSILFLPAILALAYDDLPYHLKPCFLYLSQFPEGYMISIGKLIQLWVAEGILSNDKGESIEDIAESNIIELAKRCMVQVREGEVNMKFKTCYLHDVYRDLCLSKASQEEFAFIPEKPFSLPYMISRRVRRVAMHEYIPIQSLRNLKLMSLLFFNELYPEESSISSSLKETAEIYLREDKRWISMLWILFKLMWRFRRILNYLFNNFKLLRILDLEGAEIYMEGEFLRDIGKLIRLRYLSLKGTTSFSKLSQSIGNLKRLQTLDLRMNEEFPVQIPNVICKMEMLMYLYLPMVCDRKTKLRLNTLRKLRTLVNFNSKNFYVEDLGCMTNLMELGITRFFCRDDCEVNLGSNPPVIIASEHFRSLSVSRPENIDFNLLAYLISTCVHISELSLTCSIGESLPEYQFPYQITFMSLSETELSTDPMPTLGKLPNLKILKLQKAFIGEEFHCSTEGFPELYSLKLSSISTVKRWIVDKSSMPKLRHLEITDCKSLEMLPVGLMFITTLEELKIELMPKAFKDRLCEGDEFNKIKHIDR
ncbi:putative disease resistance RPP8-like protein 2 [Gossypium australe]|uniref:Putative disease resistance RPP8-like protein 2 n=1 Tax=Gossypium australe TaxID=47621 RepID=A0A5B6UDY6_9ROSI|nr:putative disease resistance RPP8-like protein 2 [Gossypium australe]